MNTFDQSLLMGFTSGVFFAVLFWLGVKISRDEKPVMPGSPDWPEAPLRPLTDADIRLIRVCESCRRYIGQRRTIEPGQHIGMMHDVCPHCAKRRAVISAGVEQTA